MVKHKCTSDLPPKIYLKASMLQWRGYSIRFASLQHHYVIFIINKGVGCEVLQCFRYFITVRSTKPVC